MPFKRERFQGRFAVPTAFAAFDANTYLRLAGRQAVYPLGCNFNLPPEVAANSPQAAGTRANRPVGSLSRAGSRRERTRIKRWNLTLILYLND